MKTADAEKYFGGRMGIVRALGNRTKAAIYHWEDVVPFAAAHELAAKSEGKLVVDGSLYDTRGHIKASAVSA